MIFLPHSSHTYIEKTNTRTANQDSSRSFVGDPMNSIAFASFLRRLVGVCVIVIGSSGALSWDAAVHRHYLFYRHYDSHQ